MLLSFLNKWSIFLYQKELFLKWVSLDSTSDLYSKLLKEVSMNKITDLSGPTPLFSSSKPILSAGIKSPSTPPKSNSDFGYIIIIKIFFFGLFTTQANSPTYFFILKNISFLNTIFYFIYKYHLFSCSQHPDRSFTIKIKYFYLHIFFFFTYLIKTISKFRYIKI